MALVFMDGFDHYRGSDILKKWDSIFGAVVADVLVGPQWARPPGGFGFCSNAANGGYGIFKYLGSSNPSTVIFGANVYIAGWYAQPWIGLWDGYVPGNNGPQFGFGTDGSGHLYVSSGGVTLTTSTNILSLNTWYHIELKVTIHNSTGSYEVRVNGSSTGWIPPQTNKNTRQQSANAYVNWLSIQGNLNYWDDLYVLDSTGSAANDFLGPQKITAIYPNAVGAHADWTGSYASNFVNVNETTPDGDVTFNQSSTVNNIDTFVFDDVPSGTVAAIQHVIMARQDAGGPRTFAPVQRSGSTDYVGTTFALAGTHRYFLDPKSINPDTSAAWTASAVNAAEFGYKLIS